MAERPALKVIEGGTTDQGGPLAMENAVIVSLCGSSAELFENCRGGSDRSDAIVGALFRVMAAVRLSYMEDDHESDAFA